MVHIQQSRQMDRPFDDRFQANGPAPEKDPLLTFKVKFASPPGEEQLLT